MADITENQQIKYEKLKQYIKELGSVAVAFQVELILRFC